MLHTHIVQQSGANTTGPCCYPTELSSLQVRLPAAPAATHLHNLQILYVAQSGEVVQASLPNMIANKCGCA